MLYFELRNSSKADIFKTLRKRGGASMSKSAAADYAGLI